VLARREFELLPACEAQWDFVLVPLALVNLHQCPNGIGEHLHGLCPLLGTISPDSLQGHLRQCIMGTRAVGGQRKIIRVTQDKTSLLELVDHLAANRLAGILGVLTSVSFLDLDQNIVNAKTMAFSLTPRRVL